jgi:hypothetical protein
MTSVHTATGTIKGKFVYMSPEQSAADPIDRRSGHLFSLGIVLYEMTLPREPVRPAERRACPSRPSSATTIPPPSTKRAGRRAPRRDPAEGPREAARGSLPDRDRDARRAPEPLPGRHVAQPAEEDLTVVPPRALHARDIEEEDRLLAEADQATTPPEPAEMGAAEPSPDLIDAGSTEAPAQHPAFADEEPTLAGDLEDIQQRSENRSNLFDHSGAAVIDPDGDSGDLPHHNTRSDRVPKQSEAELVDDFPEEGATEVPPERETNPEIPSGLLQQPDNLPPQPRTPRARSDPDSDAAAQLDRARRPADADAPGGLRRAHAPGAGAGVDPGSDPGDQEERAAGARTSARAAAGLSHHRRGAEQLHAPQT